MRGGFTEPLPDAEDPAEAALRELRLGPDLAGDARLLRHRLRRLGDRGRRQVARRRVHQVASPAHGVDEIVGSCQRVARGASRPTCAEPTTVTDSRSASSSFEVVL